MRAPDGLRGLTTASRSNLCSPCDRRQAVAGHAGSFTHRHRRVEFLACLQHAEAKHQKLAHGSDHNLLSLEAALSLEPFINRHFETSGCGSITAARSLS